MSRLCLGFTIMTLVLFAGTQASHAQRAMAHPIQRPTAARPVQPGAAAQHRTPAPANGH